MIKSFADRKTADAYVTGQSQDPPANALRRRFALLDNAVTLKDLAAVPGNNFEKYNDHRKGQYSIRVNQKYRLFFTWEDGHPHNVRLANEH
jgi:proteic killer suppression protein